MIKVVTVLKLQYASRKLAKSSSEAFKLKGFACQVNWYTLWQSILEFTKSSPKSKFSHQSVGTELFHIMVQGTNISSVNNLLEQNSSLPWAKVHAVHAWEGAGCQIKKKDKFTKWTVKSRSSVNKLLKQNSFVLRSKVKTEVQSTICWDRILPDHWPIYMQCMHDETTWKVVQDSRGAR